MGNTVESFTGKRKITYSKQIHTYKTGDVLIFSGFGWDSFMVKTFTTTPWSHIGLIIKIDNPELIKPHLKDPDNLYIFHSTLVSYNEFVPDVVSGTVKGGVQLNSLKGVIKYYKGRIIIRRLYKPIPNIDDASITSFILKHIQKPYERGISELLNSVYRGRCAPVCTSDDNSFFCSELATTTYRDLFGIFSIHTESYKYIPADYASGGEMSNRLKDLGYPLKREVEFVRDSL
jgi:hypothetical protein